MAKKLPETMDYNDISAATGIPNGHLRVMKQRGVLPTPLHPDHPVWLKADIDRWMAERTAEETRLRDQAEKEVGE